MAESSSPTITFAVPFYENLAFLGQAIESVLRQSRDDWDLILVDDNPRDQGARQLIDRYNDSRIRYFKNTQNLGLAGNWNRCLDLAETDLVTLLHADDVLTETYAELMISSALKYPEAAL